MYYGYCGPPVTGQNSGYDQFPLAVNGWGTIHPIPGNGPTTQWWRGGATSLKRTNHGNNPRHHFSNLWLVRADGISPPVKCAWVLPSLLRPFHHHFPAPSASFDDPGQRTKPPVKRAQGLPTADNHHPLQASGSGGLRCLAQRDVAVGTHVHLTECTQVWNSSHHRLTQLY
jgi:hypothetical protein